ncbi:hypothetical protein PMAYCL1PPCAC_21091, partial [Pristionchus mayeri]
MCSFLVQIIYGVFSVLTLILTVVALAANGWKSAGDELDSVGLMCNPMKAEPNKDGFKFDCPIDLSLWEKMPFAGKLIFICLILAIIMELVCIAYNIFSAFACCCKASLLYALLAMTVFVNIMLITVVACGFSFTPDVTLDGVGDKFKEAGKEAKK